MSALPLFLSKSNDGWQGTDQISPMVSGLRFLTRHHTKFLAIEYLRSMGDDRCRRLRQPQFHRRAFTERAGSRENTVMGGDKTLTDGETETAASF